MITFEEQPRDLPFAPRAVPKHNAETGDPYSSSSCTLESKDDLALERWICPRVFEGVNGEDGTEQDGGHDDEDDNDEAGDGG